MKSFAICVACLAASVPLQARKMDAAGARKVLSMARKPTEEQTVDEILADVPSEAEESIDASYKDFDPSAAFKEDTDIGVTAFKGPSGAQDVAIQPSSGLSVQRETGATLQGLMSSPAESSPAEEPKMPANLDSIEQTVLHLAETAKKHGKADDAMLEMIRSINKILEDTIVTDLVNQYNQAVDSVFTAQKNVVDCINGSKASYNPQISPNTYNLSYYDGKHFTCRQEQLTKSNLGKKMGGSCDAYKDRCAMLNKTWNSEGNGNIVDWRTCLVQPGKYQGSMWLGDYYQDQHAFWVALWGELNRSKGYVDGNCSIWSECESNKSKYVADVAALETRCNALQASMDDASCKYKKAVDTEWDIYEDCCKSANSECPPVLEKAKTDIIYLDAQYVATARIQCYISAFGVANIEKALDDCRSNAYSTRYAPPNRYPPRKYNSVVPFPACPVCPGVPHECGDKMTGDYVTGPNIVADNARYKNMSYIAGTPAYETVHYRPAAVKHIVTDCAASCCPNKCR